MNFVNAIADLIERAVSGFVLLMIAVIMIGAFVSQSDFTSSQSDQTTDGNGTALKRSLGDPTMARAYRTLKRQGMLSGSRNSLTDADRRKLNSYYMQLRSSQRANSNYSGFDNSSDPFHEPGSGDWGSRY